MVIFGSSSVEAGEFNDIFNSTTEEFISIAYLSRLLSKT